LGNLVGSFLGFNEQTPDQIGFDPTNPVGPDASWSFDPAGLIGGAIGAGFGVPLTGILADQLSAVAGRPLAIDLGPSVIDTPEGEHTYTGGSVTVHDPNDSQTAFGVSPRAGAMLNGISNAAQPSPTRQTFVGVDPSAPEPAPTPVTDPMLPTDVSAPEPIDASNVAVNAGNSGLTEQQLTDLFSGFLMPKTYRGRNRQAVIV
jgi:hypothetical protein